MSAQPFRKMNALEVALIQKLPAPDLPWRGNLRKQIDHASVMCLDKFGSLEFLIPNELRADIPDGPILNARQSDTDTLANP